MIYNDNFECYRLSNGIRLVHLQNASLVSHAGVIIEAGTRHEEAAEHGLAHFIEHCLFKGTRHRKAFQVNAWLEDVGGDLNAYTAREETFIYASFLSPYYKRAFDLFSDILFHSSFPPKEIEKEKQVVLEEINSYKDNPYEMVYEHFEELLLHHHPLGRNILGTERSVKSFSPDHIRRFIARLYTPQRMVICSVGSISGEELRALAEKYFRDIPGVTDNQQDTNKIFDVSTASTFIKSIRKKSFQTHCVVGNLAYSYKDPRRTAFSLLVNLLGGPAMSSRLNRSIREKYGHAYQIEATYTPLYETGIFSVYLGTDTIHLDKSLEIMEKEFKKLREEKIGPVQFKKAREQFKGQIAISMESNLHQMLSIGKSYLIYNKVDTLAEVISKIDSLKPEDLMEVANDILVPGKLSRLAYLSK